MSGNSQNLSREELDSLTQVIKKKFGIDFTEYEPKSLLRRVNHALKVLKLNGTIDLWGKILKDPKFIFSFIDELTVGMTSMFRDPQFWIKFRNLLEEDYFGKNIIKVWHAGCSTGEEIYTMGLLMNSIKTD
jgi:chemotaxis protein methyltransferase CheR